MSKCPCKDKTCKYSIKHKEGEEMKRIQYNIEMKKACKPNNHKIDVYVIQEYIDGFGKSFEDRKLFDTILPSEKDTILAQIHNIYQ